jgi:hypothetical protein
MVKVNGYCMKCKAKRDMEDPKKVMMKNGKPATSGTCPKCGTKMFKIGGYKKGGECCGGCECGCTPEEHKNGKCMCQCAECMKAKSGGSGRRKSRKSSSSGKRRRSRKSGSGKRRPSRSSRK